MSEEQDRLRAALANDAPRPEAWRSTPIGATVIHPDDLKSFLTDFFGCDGQVKGISYSTTSEEWVGGDYADVLRKEQYRYGELYQRKKFNCVNFSEFASALAQIINAADGNSIDARLAFGEFCYWPKTNPGQGHEINFIVKRVADTLRVFFFEPQTLQIINVTPDEVKSCMRWSV